ncbi:dihydrolipoamide acetyltransferase family protein [Photobacterium lutimaris]|nr:dihydrolipoamide acetyltransferase family protein [Photobacterium lutimaris]TDR76364.1 pyruvate dehydrogenase E2 component (dihydrolipoamide acetyltransferase) [Photobacterium lutimaris]
MMNNSSPSYPLVDITMPALGADMRDGTLIDWQVRPGDQVKKGDIIAVIETNKGAIDMEAYHDGIITELLVMPTIKLPVGSVMARMAETTSQSPSSKTTHVSHPITSSTHTSPEHESHDMTAQSAPIAHRPYLPPHTGRHESLGSTRPMASPAARQQANQRGITLSGLLGSGPSGAILLRDLPAVPEAQASRDVDNRKSTMRQAISDAMSLSKQQIPHYYLSLEINLSKTQQWLIRQNQQREPEQRLLITAVILTAIARQLPRYPALNGFYQNGNFTPSQAIHIGNTISLRDEGLVVPAILNADQLNLDQIMVSLRDQTERGRRGRLRSSELGSATVTVTSIGDRGADAITGVIYPPQVAIVGLGRLRQAPIVDSGNIAIGDLMTVTLSADHRVSDGLVGSRFLNAIAKQLQHPEDLL